MDLDLSGKRVLVTGGSRGIGRAIVEAFTKEGARVAYCARSIDGATSMGIPIVADVATEAGARAAVTAAVDVLSGLDVLVNNVGGSLSTGRFDEASAADWQRVIDLNLMSAVWCSQAALPALVGHGAIVHIASVYGREYGPSAAYVAAKGGLIALTKEMGVDLARKGIRVCAVAPGSVLFPGGSWDRRQKSDPDRFHSTQKEIPWNRFGKPEEVADAVVYLASARASWITGVTVPVDGGQGRAL